MIGHSYSLISVITPGWVGSQAVLPDQILLLAGLHNEAGSKTGLGGQIQPLPTLCNQTGPQAVS